MFKKLQKKWGVNSIQLMLILTTFALGGSACARLAQLFLQYLNLEKGLLWGVLDIILITFLWPICVLLISIPLFQFRFFKNYTKKIFTKIFKSQIKNHHLCIFASGAGSNADKIIEHFQAHPFIRVVLIVTNNPHAGVIQIANKHQIPYEIITNNDLLDSKPLIQKLESKAVRTIILAGFLKKIPSSIINQFPNQIINIHPALLPKYGGKGMYGDAVHTAVIANKESESGITIHLVDEIYDHGIILFQKTCSIDQKETPASLAAKIHKLEHSFFPETIQAYIEKQR